MERKEDHVYARFSGCLTWSGREDKFPLTWAPAKEMWPWPSKVKKCTNYNSPPPSPPLLEAKMSSWVSKWVGGWVSVYVTIEYERRRLNPQLYVYCSLLSFILYSSLLALVCFGISLAVRRLVTISSNSFEFYLVILVKESGAAV